MQSYTEMHFVIVTCANISVKNIEIYTRYICKEDGSQDNKFETQVGLNYLLFCLGLDPFFLMHIILLSLNDSRKSTEVFWTVL